MLLDRIDVSKSYGPDKLPGRLLQCLVKEITPIVHYILPTDWTQANVAPSFKKGSVLPFCISDMYYMQAIGAHYL